MHGLLDDLGSALREFRRHPGIALVVVFTLGGAMGVSTSLFAVVNTLWFQPWRVKDAERVVVVRGAVSPAEWQHWAQHTRAFSGLAQTTPRLVMQTRKTGSTKQARKRFRLTVEGIRRVGQMLGDATPTTSGRPAEDAPL